MPSSTLINAHYAARGILERIQTGLETMGISPRLATLDHLGQADEFQVRDVDATSELIDLLDPAPDMRVLDLGSGLGGPARRLDSARGSRVTGIDLNEEFCAAGTAINRWLGLENQVELKHGDATELAPMTKSAPSPLGPHLVMGPETPLKLGNLVKHFIQGRFALVAVVCVLADKP